MITLPERRMGCLWGLLVADALSLPYQGLSSREMPPRGQVVPEPPAGFRPSVTSPAAAPGVLPYSYGSAGSQVLLLLDSLLSVEHLDVEDLSKRFLRWQEGEYWPDHDAFDIPPTLAAACRRFRKELPVVLSFSLDNVSTGTHHGLARTPALVCWHRGTDKELVQDTETMVRVTNSGISARVCASIYALWLRRVLCGYEDGAAWLDAISTYRAMRGEAEEITISNRIHKGEWSGFTIESTGVLRVTRIATQAGSGYRDVVQTAVVLGSGVNAVPALAGAIAGARHGIDAIPAPWRERLRGTTAIRPLLAQLEASHGRLHRSPAPPAQAST